MKKYFLLSCVVVLVLSGGVFLGHAQDTNKSLEEVGLVPNTGQTMNIQEYIELATRHDTVFEEILLDELSLAYEKDLNLSARDLILSVKTQYDFFLDQNRGNPEASISLEKLFPEAGTTVTAKYTATPAYLKDDIASTFNLTVSQPIAENAFGKSYRLQDKIVGVEIDVARHQIVEAYEDYLATIIVAYYDWFEAYENLELGKSSYEQNLKLLENIKDRQKSSIALPIDVNKTHLLVLAKEEKYIELQERYSRAFNFIKKAIRFENGQPPIPVGPEIYRLENISFEKEYPQFKEESRTYTILALLEKKSVLDVDKNADDLLPSINILLGYEARGQEFGVREDNNLVFGGISFDWPFPDQVERAEYETSKIAMKKTMLSTDSAQHQLYTDINNLSLQFEREKALGKIAGTKVSLAQSVLEDETENYSFGKVTLNDYIAAVNTLDNNRFNQIFYEAQQRKLMIEWLRITDVLVSKSPGYRP
ncbi:TolC family protein [Candidatus Omnitrophota bacterium]